MKKVVCETALLLATVMVPVAGVGNNAAVAGEDERTNHYLAAAAKPDSSPLRTGSHIDGLFIVPMPPGITRKDIGSLDNRTRELLHRHVSDWLERDVETRPAEPGVDRTIILKDRSGRLILPDLERIRGRSPRSLADNDLTYSFNSPSHPWTNEEISRLRTALNDFEAAAKTIYGPPAFSITVNVRRDPALGVAGAYFPDWERDGAAERHGTGCRLS
jgi:hypothetical protein